MAPPVSPLVGRSEADLIALAESLGHRAFRGRQLYEWIYHRRALTFDEMTNLSKAFRVQLAERHTVHPLQLVDRRASSDGSAKLLFQLADGAYIEGVLMPDGDRLTLCVSSQVGCAVDCKFCLTGLMGFKRNLTPGEIVSQVLFAMRDPLAENRRPDADAASQPPQLTNVVFMGMGEPMLNPRGVIGAIRLMTDTEGRGMGIASRRITVSTAGVVPGIVRLSEAELGVRLAISLNGATDDQRSATMPINRVYGLDALLEAARTFKRRKGDRVTFEYVMIRDFNDSPDDARRLARLLAPLRCKVNLIPFNPDPMLPYRRPETASVEAFQEILRGGRIGTSVRWSKGLDVDAACGQLAGRWRPDADDAAPPPSDAPGAAAVARMNPAN